MLRLGLFNCKVCIVDFGLIKIIAGYLTASAVALVTSLELACAFGGELMLTFSGNFFR